jgi:hypothetical protein
MTVVDVFETDNQGKLLSYCPTFDNRAIHKTNQTTESLRKNSSKFISVLAKAQKSKLAALIMSKAQYVATSVKRKMGEAVNSYNHSPTINNSSGNMIRQQDQVENPKGETTNAQEVESMEPNEMEI